MRRLPSTRLPRRAKILTTQATQAPQTALSLSKGLCSVLQTCSQRQQRWSSIKRKPLPSRFSPPA